MYVSTHPLQSDDTTTPSLSLYSGHPLVSLYQVSVQYWTQKRLRYTDLSVSELFRSISVSIPIRIDSTNTYETSTSIHDIIAPTRRLITIPFPFKSLTR